MDSIGATDFFVEDTMKIGRAIFTYFDLFDGYDSWRYKKTISNPGWWKKRAPITEKYMVGSMAAMKNPDFDWIASFRKECMDKANPVLDVMVKANDAEVFAGPKNAVAIVNEHGDPWASNRTLFAELCHRYHDSDFVLLASCDSDDMWRCDLWEELDQYELDIPGLLFVTKNGYAYDIDHDIFMRWESETCPAFFVYVIPKRALQNPVKLSTYWHKWNFHHNHPQLAAHKTAVTLRDGMYCCTMSGTNTSKLYTNQFAQQHIGKQIKDKTMMLAFGQDRIEGPRINTQEWWDLKGEKYLAKDDNRIRKNEFRKISEMVGPTVLEIGSAFGELSSFMPEGTEYTGFEISPVMVLEARKRFPKTEFLCGDIAQDRDKAPLHGLQIRQFDTGIALQVLEHFEDPCAIVDQIRKLVSRQLIFNVPREGLRPTHYQNDGHVSWWRNEEDVIKTFGQFGKITFWEGKTNHISGVITWTK